MLFESELSLDKRKLARDGWPSRKKKKTLRISTTTGYYYEPGTYKHADERNVTCLVWASSQTDRNDWSVLKIRRENFKKNERTSAVNWTTNIWSLTCAGRPWPRFICFVRSVLYRRRVIYSVRNPCSSPDRCCSRGVVETGNRGARGAIRFFPVTVGDGVVRLIFTK